MRNIFLSLIHYETLRYEYKKCKYKNTKVLYKKLTFFDKRFIAMTKSNRFFNHIIEHRNTSNKLYFSISVLKILP